MKENAIKYKHHRQISMWWKIT